MQSGVSGRPATRPLPALQRHPRFASRQPARRPSVPQPSHTGTSALPPSSVAYHARAHRARRGRQPRSTAQFEHHQPAEAQVDQSIDSFSNRAIRNLSDALPKLALLCCLLILASTIVRIPLLLHQSGMLTLAGILLTWQSLKARISISRFQHKLQAAAAEAETEAAADTPTDDEQANENSVIESGAELGSVQTPASVWLPYNSTAASSKVKFTTSLFMHKAAHCQVLLSSLSHHTLGLSSRGGSLAHSN